MTSRRWFLRHKGTILWQTGRCRVLTGLVGSNWHFLINQNFRCMLCTARFLILFLWSPWLSCTYFALFRFLDYTFSFCVCIFLFLVPQWIVLATHHFETCVSLPAHSCRPFTPLGLHRVGCLFCLVNIRVALRDSLFTCITWWFLPPGLHAVKRVNCLSSYASLRDSLLLGFHGVKCLNCLLYYLLISSNLSGTVFLHVNNLVVLRCSVSMVTHVSIV